MRTYSFLERPKFWRGAALASSPVPACYTQLWGRSSMTGTLPCRDRAAQPFAFDPAAWSRPGWDRPTLLASLVAIARPDRWFRNIFMLPGGSARAGPDALFLPRRGRAAAAGAGPRMRDRLCRLHDHDWLDAEFDGHHPVKKLRPSAAGQITAPVGYALRKLGPRRRANYAKPLARLAVFAWIAEH
jgi:hypothetical protein